MPEPKAYKDVLAGNIRAARARANLSQAALAARMKALGFTQIYGATIGAIERADRTLGAVEVAGISLCLNTTVSALMLPTLEAGSTVIFPNGDRVPSQRLAIIDDSVSWDGNTPKITAPSETYRPADVIAAIHATLQAVREPSALPPPHPDDLGPADIRPSRPEDPPSEPLERNNDEGEDQEE
jgi:hypothetical protein